MLEAEVETGAFDAEAVAGGLIDRVVGDEGRKCPVQPEARRRVCVNEIVDPGGRAVPFNADAVGVDDISAGIGGVGGVDAVGHVVENAVVVYRAAGGSDPGVVGKDDVLGGLGAARC